MRTILRQITGNDSSRGRSRLAKPFPEIELAGLLHHGLDIRSVDRASITYELVLCGSVDKAVPLTEAVVVVVADEATLLELVDCRDELCILLEVNCVVGLDD